MLKRKYRLNFKTKPKFTKSINSPFFTLKIAQNQFSYNRYGFVISKKIDKRAVVRNKIKRIFHNCTGSFLGEIKTGYDMVFLIKRGVFNIPKDRFCLLIKEIFAKEGFLK